MTSPDRSALKHSWLSFHQFSLSPECVLDCAISIDVLDSQYCSGPEKRQTNMMIVHQRRSQVEVFLPEKFHVCLFKHSEKTLLGNVPFLFCSV